MIPNIILTLGGKRWNDFWVLSTVLIDGYTQQIIPSLPHNPFRLAFCFIKKYLIFSIQQTTIIFTDKVNLQYFSDCWFTARKIRAVAAGKLGSCDVDDW